MTTAVEQRPTRLRYRPELDGVRGIAVLIVLAFHLSFLDRWFWHFGRGGYACVDVFFVLSGMLITQLLDVDVVAGRHRLNRFNERRVRRLIPALATMLILVLGYDAVVHNTGRTNLHGLGSVVSYVTVGHLFGPFPDGVSQTWTLVIEWEFYLIWPVLFTLAVRRFNQNQIGISALVVAAIIGVLRPITYLHVHRNFNLMFHLAVFRVDELLIGAALGLLGHRLRVPNIIRTLAFIAVLYTITRTTVSGSWVYLGGMTGIALCTAAVIAPRDKKWWGDRILTFGPLVWVGKLSYSLYLWSVPIGSEVLHHTPGLSPAERVLLAIALSFAFAMASYYLIESRFRKSSRQPLSAT